MGLREATERDYTWSHAQRAFVPGARTSVRLIWRDGTLIRQPAAEDPDRVEP